MGGPLTVVVSLAAALLVSSKLTRFRGLWRTIYFAPVVTTLVAVAVVWRYLYHTRYGTLNHVLGWFGIEPIDWLGDSRWAMFAIILLAVWKNFGYNMVIFVAGLQSIPEEMYEAARIDGAGPWHTFWNIKLPLLAPTFFFVGVTTMIGYFQLFAEPYVMTLGGPLHSTYSLVMFMYEEGFRWWRIGFASAIAFVLVRDHFWRQPWFKFACNGVGLTYERASPNLVDPFAAIRRRGNHRLPARVDGHGIADADRARPNPYRHGSWPSRITFAHYADLFERLNLARYFANSLLIASTVTVLSVIIEFAGRLRLGEVAIRRAGCNFPPARRRLDHPRSSGDDPAVLVDEATGNDQYLLGRDSAGGGKHLWHDSRPAICAVAFPMRCWTPRGSTERAKPGFIGRLRYHFCGRSWSRSAYSRL